jgi:hypothetical protein
MKSRDRIKKLSLQHMATRAAFLLVFAVSLAASGLVLSANAGTITTFDVPGSILTQPQSINSRGVITGVYLDPSNLSHGFLRSATGAITTFDVPGSNNPAPNAWPYSINSGGAITGTYVDLNGTHGFLRSATGAFTTFDPPYAIGTNASTQPYSINGGGTITGYYYDNGTHGFPAFRDRNDHRLRCTGRSTRRGRDYSPLKH